MVNAPAQPEFSVPVPLSEIGAGAAHRSLAANEAERVALAKRFALFSLDLLAAELDVHRDGDSILANGAFTAVAVQPCVATGEPVSANIDEPLHIRFVAESEFAPDAEVELDAKDCDTMFHNGRVVDLGEAVAQSLALALPPFPRSFAAETVLKAAGVKGEDEAGAFGALAALRDKMGKR